MRYSGECPIRRKLLLRLKDVQVTGYENPDAISFSEFTQSSLHSLGTNQPDASELDAKSAQLIHIPWSRDQSRDQELAVRFNP